MDVVWNLWHGCKKYSAGCKNCYVYRTDAKYDRDSSLITKNKSFDLPIRRNRAKEYKYPSGTMFWTCFTSDFLIADCDQWRGEAFLMMKERMDCRFLFLTKRIDRFESIAPKDWGDGYDNVWVGVTCEDQNAADYRLPIFSRLPIKHKLIICEPLLGEIDLSGHLNIEYKEVLVGGESGLEARACSYDWVLGIREQCLDFGIKFTFRQTGSRLVKGGKLYNIPRKYQHVQARKAGINT